MSDVTRNEMLNELAALKKYFGDAMNELQNGKIRSLDGLDQRIAAICQRVEKSNSADQKVCLPEMANLIDYLNTYENALRAFQEAQLAQAEKILAADASASNANA